MSFVSIIEIPVQDFARAKKFYQLAFEVSLEEVEMGETLMGLFPGGDDVVNVALVKGDDYLPSADGTLVYLSAGDDLQPVLDRIVNAGGKISVPKTEISPEMGFFAHFIDTEGNKVALHSVGSV